MYLIILLWQLAVNQQPFYLDTDLKRAQHILRDEHGVWLSNEDKPYFLKVFEPYAKMNLVNFKFSSRKDGKYNINCWKRRDKTKLEIYQVETKLHVDSIYITSDFTDLAGKRTVKKRHIVVDFNYRTYVIKDSGKPQLIFTIAAKGEHLNYSIGNHSVDPLYESIPVGLQTPDEKEILKAIGQ